MTCLDVAAEEATEDIQKMGGSEALDEPYTTIALTKMVKKRASWLVVLFLGEMLTATAMSYFEDELAKASCFPCSSRWSSARAVTPARRRRAGHPRAALGEFKLRDWWRIMRRELAPA